MLDTAITLLKQYGPYGAGLLALLIVLEYRFDKPSTNHGSANWLPFFDAYLHGLFQKGGLLIGDWAGLSPIYAKSHHSVTFGSTGSGKGATAIMPNSIGRDYLFLVDPGGENTAIAIKDWRARGLDVQVIDPFGLHSGAPWHLPRMAFNPLDTLNPASRTLASDAQVVASMLITRSGKESGSAAYFLDAATSMLRAMLIHIVTQEPRERQTLGTLNSYLNATARDWSRLIKSMTRNEAAGGVVIRQANVLDRRENQAPEEHSAVLSTAQQALSWLDDPVMADALTHSDVDFSLLKGRTEGSRGTAISLILPLDYISTHSALTRLVLACAVLTLQREPRAKETVLFILDEAAALGRVEALSNWLVTMRKYKAQFWPIFQNLGQLKNLYRDEWGDFLANCGMIQFLSVSDLETGKTVQEILGNKTGQTVTTNGRGEKSVAEMSRPLMTVDELRRMETKYQIVFYENLHPLLVRKTPYWERPEFAGRVHRNPFYPNALHIGQRPIARIQGRMLLTAGFLLGPHPFMALVYLGAIVGTGFKILT